MKQLLTIIFGLLLVAVTLDVSGNAGIDLDDGVEIVVLEDVSVDMPSLTKIDFQQTFPDVDIGTFYDRTIYSTEQKSANAFLYKPHDFRRARDGLRHVLVIHSTAKFSGATG